MQHHRVSNAFYKGIAWGVVLGLLSWAALYGVFRFIMWVVMG